MSCNIFKDKLEDYILGNTSDDLKVALEKHMKGCESCRRLYEEEVKIDTDFKMILSMDGIDFNRSRASIIKSIDKNRYSTKTPNKILYNFKKYKNKYLSYAVAVIAMIVFIPMMLKGFPGIEYNSGTANKSTAMDQSQQEITKSSENNYGDSAKKSLVMDKTDEKSVGSKSAQLQNGTLQFKKSIIAKLPILSYELKWKNSTDGKTSAAIDTVVGGDVDFGIHIIYIKNLNTNELVKYEVINNHRQFTPRNIQWWDNEHLIIVAGYGYGTVAFGSEVYSLNINTSELSTLYLEKDKKQQILEFEKQGQDLIFQLIIYNDDTYNAFHKGVGKMTILQLEKQAEIQIISEEKK